MLLALGANELGSRFGLCQEPERFTEPAYKSSFKPAS